MQQFVIDSLFSANIYLLIGLSFSKIFEIADFFHFAHAVILTSGAYFTFLFSQLFGWSLSVSIPLAIVCSCILGCLIELLIYKRLRKNKSTALVMMLASLGIYIVLQNVISMVFGDDTKSIRTWEVVEGINVFGARITPVQIIIIVVSICLLILVACYLHLSKTGKAMRAVASDPNLQTLPE